MLGFHQNPGEREGYNINPLETILSLGLQVAKDEHGKLLVFGFSDMAPSDAEKAAAFVRENRQMISALIDATDVFKVTMPGYCPTCPAYVKGWELQHKGTRHTEWCVSSAYFDGKAGKPIPLDRYTPGLPAFKLVDKKKVTLCPRLK